MNLRSSCYYEARTPKMPVGLVELMEDLSKDVLKNNPTDIYSFCANHMKKLLIIRDGSSMCFFVSSILICSNTYYIRIQNIFSLVLL